MTEACKSMNCTDQKSGKRILPDLAGMHMPVPEIRNMIVMMNVRGIMRMLVCFSLMIVMVVPGSMFMFVRMVLTVRLMMRVIMDRIAMGMIVRRGMIK